MQFPNEHELRAFLRLCIDPGPGRNKRTPVHMLEVLPHHLHEQIADHAPYLGAFRYTATELARRAEEMRNAYAAAVLGFIRGELPTDQALAHVEAGNQHARDCRTCTDPGVLSARCAEATRLAHALLAPAETAPEAQAPVPEVQAERLATLTDCHGGTLHCEHHQDGDGGCCRCGRANWCPDDGVTAAEPEEQPEPADADAWPAALCTRDGRHWTRATGPETEGADLYESPTSPRRYTPAALLRLYGQITAAPADGE